MCWYPFLRSTECSGDVSFSLSISFFCSACEAVSEPTQISHRHKIFVSGISGNGKYKKSTYKLNYVSKLEKHTPGTPKITKIHPPAPFPPVALPPISMGRAAVPPTNGSAAPDGPARGARGWVWWRNGWFAYLGPLFKETREKWCVGLKWPPFSGNTQQPTNSWRKL